ncbi:MAG: hypothetical protein Q9M16_05225 [Mariprofundus sp.]|nr:hypothetical protein [Mariprofundus sp.]
MSRTWKILLYCCCALLAACSNANKPSAISGSVSGQALQNGVCEVKGEWAGYQFDVELKRLNEQLLDVKIDMSATKWDVGVVAASLAINGKKLKPSRASAGAVTEHASNNIPAMVGAAGVLLDRYRNRKVGNKRQIATAATGAAAVGWTIRETEKRKQQFDADTAIWAGLFEQTAVADCDAQLQIRFWSPETGVTSRRKVNVGKCFCN